jgi:hypothetical protein
MKKNLILFFIICLMANTILPVFEVYDSGSKETHFKKLSRIFGDKVLICDASTIKKSYFSTFERLDQEHHQKLKKQIDIASITHAFSDAKYIHDIYPAYIAALHRGTVRPYEITLNLKDAKSFQKSSRAPPLYS